MQKWTLKYVSAMSTLEILLLYNNYQNQFHNSLRSHILKLDELPEELLARPRDLASLKEYIQKNDKFGHFVEENSSLFVSDLKPGYTTIFIVFTRRGF